MNLGQLRKVSGLQKSLSRRTPLLPDPPIYPRMAKSPYYAVPANRDGFDGFFGLTPSQPEEPKTVQRESGPALTYGELLERENAAYVQRTKQRAAATFKKGTSPDEENRQEQLSRAQDLLSQILRTDATDPVPALLSLHTALEKNYIVVAGRSLLELVSRDPEFFLHEPKVAQYFGDAQLLQTQMRHYRAAGERNPTDPYAWAIQAYCNWTLGDATRARQAIQSMLQANRQTGGSPRIRTFGYALSAALSAAND